MRRVIYCGLGLLMGYVAAALLAGSLIESLSSGRGPSDAAVMAEFIFGPLGALVGTAVGWLAANAAQARNSFDIRDRKRR
jgi:hypothetical protein